MSKILVLAEKPSVGRDIARVLGCKKKINGAIEGDKYIVTWALGHLVTLSDPEQYDDKYKEWKLIDLPMLPDHLKIEVIRQTGKQYQAVKTQLQRKDVTEVVIATDAGREGELVARWILDKVHNQKPCKRLWISSVTDRAIKEGFSHLRPAKEYDNLYRAAVCRAEADWLVGINATRALTCKYNAQLSCGRVQTPTLSMIAKREQEIREFVPKAYYGISAKVILADHSVLSFTWTDNKTNQNNSFNKEKIETIKKRIQNEKAMVTEVSEKAKKTYAPLLYDLTELQRDANKRYDFSAKQTLNIMQRLYENYKIVTYPRTDSRYVTKDIVPTIKERLMSCAVGPHKKYAAKAMNMQISTKAAFVDDSKVSDHHAIIPTEQYVPYLDLSSEERKIYDLIVKRFLEVLYPPYEYSQTKMKLNIGGEVFTTSVNVVMKQGYKEVEAGDSENAITKQGFTQIKQGDVIAIDALEMTNGKTTPPAPFTEATLLSAMENPVKYMESKDKEDIRILGETGGLGTVATRADIIEKLFKSFLIEKRGKEIFVTSKARQLLELVPGDLKKPELTSDWEQKLSKIAKGTLRRDNFMSEIRGYTKELIGEIKEADGKFRHDNITNHKCPDCGKSMLLVKGKNSTMLVCQDRECGHRETISRVSNARCPKCHKKMELRGKGETQTFTCVCGYKEKLKAFQDRRKKEGAGVSKKDVNRYMKQMQKEEAPLNNAFADAFAKIKL